MKVLTKKVVAFKSFLISRILCRIKQLRPSPHNRLSPHRGPSPKLLLGKIKNRAVIQTKFIVRAKMLERCTFKVVTKQLSAKNSLGDKRRNRAVTI